MAKTYQTVKVNKFVKRQNSKSGKTYSIDLSFNEIALYAEKIINEHPNQIKKGYRDGVVLIKCDKNFSKLFISPMVKIDESTKLEAIVTRRRKNEDHYIQIKAIDVTPLKTEQVELILYRHDVLAENNEQSTSANWELIAFHAIPSGIDEMPMKPVTMMRNQLELSGGTKAHYSSDEWAQSVNFWQKYAVLIEEE